MINLTDDSALCSYYEKSQCNNVSEFLALSEKRFDIRGYWEPCEEMLQFILRSHFPTETPGDPQQSQVSEENIENRSILSQLNPEPQQAPTTLATHTAPTLDEIEDFVEALMAGQIAWQPLDKLENEGSKFQQWVTLLLRTVEMRQLKSVYRACRQTLYHQRLLGRIRKKTKRGVNQILPITVPRSALTGCLVARRSRRHPLLRPSPRRHSRTTTNHTKETCAFELSEDRKAKSISAHRD